MFEKSKAGQIHFIVNVGFRSGAETAPETEDMESSLLALPPTSRVL